MFDGLSQGLCYGDSQHDRGPEIISWKESGEGIAVNKKLIYK